MDWEHGWNETSQQDCPLCHSYSMYSDIINKRSRMSNTIYNGWIPSAEVIVHGNMESVEEKDLWPVRVQGFPSSPFLPIGRWDQLGMRWICWCQRRTPFSASPRWLPASHTGAPKSYGFNTDGRGGLISEWWLSGAKNTAFLGEMPA